MSKIWFNDLTNCNKDIKNEQSKKMELERIETNDRRREKGPTKKYWGTRNMVDGRGSLKSPCGDIYNFHAFLIISAK